MNEGVLKLAPAWTAIICILIMILAIGCGGKSTDEAGTVRPTGSATASESPSSSPSSLSETSASKPNAPGDGDFRSWPRPQVALVFTGHQHGYIEPCGCTGLDQQKGGVARRFTFLEQLRELGWDVLPIDTGDQVRRTGPQSSIKLRHSVRAMREMGYQAVGIGSDDLKMGVGELLAYTAENSAEDPTFISANVVLIDPTLTTQTKVIERNTRRIGITSILDPARVDATLSDEITVRPAVDMARAAAEELRRRRTDFRVLLFNGSEEKARELVSEVPGFDLVVVSGDYGDAIDTPESVAASPTKMIVTGHKGMYAPLIALYPRQPLKYAGVALSDEFTDAPQMRQLMADYQEQLQQEGLAGLGLTSPVPHPNEQRFVGSSKCGECHTKAMEKWQTTGHAMATEDIVQPKEERGDIARHFDPECLSCHVTGWNPSEYYPYDSGYVSLQDSSHLTGSGCENCHGPGSEHVAAEMGDVEVSDERLEQLRSSMRLPLSSAEDNCKRCHDVDNSPDFHEEGAFENSYWPRVRHEGLD